MRHRPASRSAAAAFLLGTLAATSPAVAETCFRQCLAGRLVSSQMSDDQIRFEMKGCRDRCERETAERSTAKGIAEKVEACRPEPLSDAEFKQVRGASPSYIVQSNAFTWDLRNPFPNKVIREIVIVAQTMDLRDTTIVARGTVLPGEQETLLSTGFFDGYPNARYATKVRSILACTID